MSAADLERLIARATPRVEDVRSCDRGDFIRREHGHLTVREVVDALDALEFTVDTFVFEMAKIAPKALDGEAETAVHGLYRAVAGLRMLDGASVPEPVDPPFLDGAQEVPSAEAAEGWRELFAVAKAAGAEAFKGKDWQIAVKGYGEAIRATPASETGELRALFSNRSAALLQAGHAVAALADASRTVEADASWPKGHFRRGTCLRQLLRFDDAVEAFRAGQVLEPENGDWAKEVEKTIRLHRAQPAVQARQMVFHMLPDLLRAWARCGEDASARPSGVLVLQVNAELAVIGEPKWQRVRDNAAPAKGQVRVCYSELKEHLGNVAENLKNPKCYPNGLLSCSSGQPVRIADAAGLLAAEAGRAAVHLDVWNGGGAKTMGGVLFSMPCDAEVRRFLGVHKDPPAPKGSVEQALKLQKTTGFPHALPQLLGFQSYPGDLNFPVIDRARDAGKELDLKVTPGPGPFDEGKQDAGAA